MNRVVDPIEVRDALSSDCAMREPRTAEIIARVERIAERTAAGQQNEEFLVQLKREWAIGLATNRLHGRAVCA